MLHRVELTVTADDGRIMAEAFAGDCDVECYINDASVNEEYLRELVMAAETGGSVQAPRIGALKLIVRNERGIRCLFLNRERCFEMNGFRADVQDRFVFHCCMEIGWPSHR